MGPKHSLSYVNIDVYQGASLEINKTYEVVYTVPTVEVGMGYFDAGTLQEDRMEENDALFILTLPKI